MNIKTLSLMTILVIGVIATSCKDNEGNCTQPSNLTSSDSYKDDYNPVYYSIPYEYEEYEIESENNEDPDMSADYIYYQSDGGIVYITRDAYGNISGHDLNGNYISGYSDQYGNTTIHDMNGNYVYSTTDDYGNTTTHDLNGNYAYSYTDDYGYTTGHNLNGNYYSAYTDDFGYTTVTTY